MGRLELPLWVKALARLSVTAGWTAGSLSVRLLGYYVKTIFRAKLRHHLPFPLCRHLHCTGAVVSKTVPTSFKNILDKPLKIILLSLSTESLTLISYVTKWATRRKPFYSWRAMTALGKGTQEIIVSWARSFFFFFFFMKHHFYLKEWWINHGHSHLGVE